MAIVLKIILFLGKWKRFGSMKWKTIISSCTGGMKQKLIPGFYIFLGVVNLCSSPVTRFKFKTKDRQISSSMKIGNMLEIFKIEKKKLLQWKYVVLFDF